MASESADLLPLGIMLFPPFFPSFSYPLLHDCVDTVFALKAEFVHLSMEYTHPSLALCSRMDRTLDSRMAPGVFTSNGGLPGLTSCVMPADIEDRLEKDSESLWNPG
jgi:hypothetical protein